MSDDKMRATENADTRVVAIRAETWRALLEIAGHQIDPENAEIYWRFGQVVDPYGVYPDVPPECDCVGRFILLGILEAASGSNSEICLRQLGRCSGYGLGVYLQS